MLKLAMTVVILARSLWAALSSRRRRRSGASSHDAGVEAAHADPVTLLAHRYSRRERGTEEYQERRRVLVAAAGEHDSRPAAPSPEASPAAAGLDPAGSNGNSDGELHLETIRR